MLAWCEDTGNAVPSLKTFQRVLLSPSWKQKLLFRTDVEQAKCNVCDDIMEARRQNHHPPTRKLLSQKLHDHWAEQQADRMVYRAIRDSSRAGGNVVSLILDGMDQAKFKCPRATIAQNHLKQVWRPQLHVTGCIIHGVADVYWIGDADLKKDANATVQFLNEAVEIAIQERLSTTGLKVPKHLVVQLDNTCRENKNNLIIRWAAGLVGTNTFMSVSLHFLRKGHTHEDIDQRFKIISTFISKHKLLETPYEFMDCIQHEMTVPPSHKLVVRQMHPPYDYWQHYGDHNIYPYDIHNHTGPNAGHAFRLVKWEAAADSQGSCSKGDVVLLVKHYMKDVRAAQAPITVIPCDACDSIPRGLPKLTTTRGPMAPTERKEYMKTVARCKQPPWHLNLAALYLEGWANFLKESEEEQPEGEDVLPAANTNPDLKWRFFRTPRSFDHTVPASDVSVVGSDQCQHTDDAYIQLLVPATNFNAVYTTHATAAKRAKQNEERTHTRAKAKPKQVRGNFGKAAKAKARGQTGAEPDGGDADGEDEDFMDEGL